MITCETKKNFEEGIKLFQKKNFKEAQIYFEKTLEIAPNSSPTLENLSKSYLETKDYDKAEKTLKYFISLNKEDDLIAYKLLYEIYSTTAPPKTILRTALYTARRATHTSRPL